MLKMRQSARFLQVLARFGWLALLLGLVLAGQGGSVLVTRADNPVHPDQQGVAEWTIMMYQVADDQTLEEDILIDMNEAELVGSTDQVNIVAQVDRLDGGYDGMGDWTSAKRFYITQDNDLNNINSEELEDLGEVNMADGSTLVDFITWATANFPANKYALILSDHGMGWIGGFTDPDPGGLGPDSVVVAEAFQSDALWLMELDRALEEARGQAGIDQFELIGLDVCLMGQLEVFTALAPHARYSVASEEVEPGVGWAYSAFLTQLADNPGMDGADLGQGIVSAFIKQDARLLNDDTRTAMFGDVPAELAIADTFSGVTLTAVDLAGIAGINAALDAFTVQLARLDPQIVATARAYAQFFESPLEGEEAPSSFIDLGHFALLVADLSGDPDVAAAVENLVNAIGQAIVAETHGENRPGATGLAFYFPVAETFSTADNFGYRIVASRFAEESRWDDFLVAFHTGDREGFSQAAPSEPPAEPPADITGELTEEDIQVLVQDVQALLELGYTADEIPGAMVDELGYNPDLVQALVDAGFFDGLEPPRPPAAEPVAAPVSGNKPIQLAPITLSAEIATDTEPVVLSTELSGSRLSYVYSFIGRYLNRENALLIEDIDYIFADENNEVGGVTFPVWPEEGLAIEYEWNPIVFAISDGENTVRALLRPATYSAERPTYATEGTYTFADGQEQYAKLLFQDGELVQVLGFSGGTNEAIGAPRQIFPKAGDQFTVLERGDDLNLEGDAAREAFSRAGGVLTFGDQPFVVEEIPAPSGNYVVGFIAEDLDGQTYEEYESIFVNSEQAGAVEGFLPYVNEGLEFALMVPETWSINDTGGDSVLIFDEAGSAEVSISRQSYPDATSTQEANDLALDAALTLLTDGGLENLQFINEEPEDFVLGAFDAKIVDFTADLDGETYYGEIIVTTPAPGATFVVFLTALDSEWDAYLEDFDALLYNFDVLISGLGKEQVGPPAPGFAGEEFIDDFSDPTSGLFDDQEDSDWGRGYYDGEGYTFELTPYAGPIYDYYADLALPDDFLLQTAASYTGAVDNAYGFIFQVQPGETDEFYTFRISGDGFYSVEKTSGDQLETLIDWTASSLIDQAEGAVNVLTVEGQGETYFLYINGQQVDSFTDADFSGGTFGYMVDNFDQDNPVSFTFDDLTAGAADR